MYQNFLYNRVSSEAWHPYQVTVEDGCTSSKCFKGSGVDIFTAAQPILNFTFVVTRRTWKDQIGKHIESILPIHTRYEISKSLFFL